MPKERKMAQDQKAAALEMIRMGLACGEIAAFFGVTRSYIWQLKQKLEHPKERKPSVVHIQARAGALVTAAVRRGVLRPQPCEVCGLQDPPSGKRLIHAHHDDYEKPLDVRWLCPAHHAEWHSNNTPKNGMPQFDKKQLATWRQIKTI